MPRSLARAEQIDYLRTAIAARCGGPIVITGEPRTGRTSVLRHALAHIDERHTAIVHLGPAGHRTPFAALSRVLPPDIGAPATVDEITGAITAAAAGRRLVVVVDDAHLADQPSMLVVRELHRRAGALLLISQPTSAPRSARPDPLDCLRHEPGLRTLRLPPLRDDEAGALTAELVGGPVRPATAAALHAATDGNPGLLHDLLVDGGLAGLLEPVRGQWQLRRVHAELTGGRHPDAVARLHDAARRAWQDLELDRADELCRLASWSGLATEVAPMWACLLLLSGRAEEGIDVLDAFADLRQPRALRVRALLLALGRGEPGEASDLLADAARDGGPASGCLLAKRAWLLASTGRTGEAEEALASLRPRADREAYVYTLAARASIAMAERPTVAVGHLRRALLGARAWRHELPWLAPYLTANLIDALLLAGRINEATAAATDFHAGVRGRGWQIAVTVADLTAAAARSARSSRSDRPLGRPVEPAC